ncbi:MAG: gliding motility-associated C-terminal domain-containing protein [Runella sp.]
MKSSMTNTVFYVFALCWPIMKVQAQADCETMAAPVISSEKQITCSGQPVVLKAIGCEGTIVWSNQKTGASLTVYPTKTTTYTAYCKKEACRSKNSNEITVSVSIPATPTIEATKTQICFGESVTLKAKGCPGDVIWSDGQIGHQITIQPLQTTSYTATCRSEGCVSCFADDIVITVLGGEPLLLTPSKTIICPSEQITIAAKGNCSGQVKWSTGETGSSIVVKPTNTTEYIAQCEGTTCNTAKSTTIVQVSPPTAPRLQTSKQSVCKGETIVLNADGCSGIVKWSNGAEGRSIEIKPEINTQYTAICKRGDCESVSSLPLLIWVEGQVPSRPQIATEISNKCPYTTVDLSSLIVPKSDPTLIYEARVGESPTSTLVANVGAVSENRTYFIFAKTPSGCYSLPAAVKVTIQHCDNPLAACVTNPATAEISKIEKTIAGNYYMEGKIGGAALIGKWSSNGTGTFNTTTGLNTIYAPSLEDRQAGSVTIFFKSDDPDGEGNCQPGISQKSLSIAPTPERPKEMIGVNKWVKNAVFLSKGLVEIEYGIQIVNMGAHDLVEVHLKDSLDQVFKNGAVIVEKPLVKAIDTNTGMEVAWGIEKNYTGQNGHYDLLVPEESSLSAGQARTISLKVKVNIDHAQDTVFYNISYATALDINGHLCQDKSANGSWPDPNQNEDPTDDSEATPIALNSILDTDKTIFIPEGFSPNSDGINDFFVIKKPSSVILSLEIYNRWGGLVFQRQDYKNDWNGGNGYDQLPTGTYFYVVKTHDGREFSRFFTLTR